MPKVFLTPFVIGLACVLSACSSGAEKAACLKVAEKILKIEKNIDIELQIAKDLAYLANERFREQYDFCLLNPDRFLNRPEIRKLPFGSTYETCGDWARWGGNQADENPKSTPAIIKLNDEISALKKENTNCFIDGIGDFKY